MPRRFTAESMRGFPSPSSSCSARALSSTRRYDDGTLTIAVLSGEDFEATGAEDSYSEGIVDHLRAVGGTKVAALIREVRGGAVKVSLRASDDEVDVSAIARDLRRRRASPRSGLLERSRRRRADRRDPRPRLSGDAGWILPADKPAGCELARHGEPRAASARSAPDRSRRHARSVRDRAPAPAGGARDAPGALLRRAAEDL